MWQQFWFQNIHYVFEVFVAFMMITAGWIYLDGWLLERKWKTLARSCGFFMLALWSFLDAIAAAPSEISKWIDPAGLLGSGLVLLSLVIDPVPIKPGEKPIKFFSKFWSKHMIVFPLGANLFEAGKSLLLPITILGNAVFFILEPKVLIFSFFALSTALLWIHYSKGIQREWKFFYVGFLLVSISSALAIAYIWQDSKNVFVSKILGPYHAVWIAEHAALFLGGAFLSAWAWGFIRFRIFPQIFSGFIAISFFIFVSTTILYTGFLLNRNQESAIKDLETNLKTFDLALRKVKDSAILAARIAAVNPRVKEAVRLNNKEVLFKNLNALMFEGNTDFMLAVNEGGEVLMRAEDKELYGDSLAEDSVVWRALDGKAVVTTAVEQGVTISKVAIRAASPILDTEEGGESRIIGAIVTGFLLDNAFVDGINKITGLGVAVFANDIRSASTFTIPESELRLVGSRETNQDVLDAVFKKRRAYTGTVSILNQPFLAAYIPIEDVEGTVVGMFFTGRPQSALFALASDTMQRTFAISIIFMIVSVLPLRLLAMFISRNQEV